MFYGYRSGPDKERSGFEAEGAKSFRTVTGVQHSDGTEVDYTYGKG